MNGPSPLEANDWEVTFTTDVDMAKEAVIANEADSTVPWRNEAVSAKEALPSN